MKLAVFFPGIGYHCDKPLLYYAKKLTQQCRYEECISLSYSYDGENIRGNQQKMQQAFEALYAQAEEKLADVDFGKYSEILFISKSVGTIIASAYALEQTYAFPHEDAIAFIGTADPWSNPQKVVKLSEQQHIPIYTYDGANHSIESADIMKNLKMLTDVMEKTKEYMNNEQTTDRRYAIMG